MIDTPGRRLPPAAGTCVRDHWREHDLSLRDSSGVASKTPGLDCEGANRTPLEETTR